MGGSTYTHSSGTIANNGFVRYINPSTRVEVSVSRPANIQVDAVYIAGSGSTNLVGSCSWSGSTFSVNIANFQFYGGEPTSGGPTATAYNGATAVRSWSGGMGGRIDWTYTAPGQPSLHSSYRTAGGTSLTFQVSSGSGRVTANYTSLDQGAWQANPNTYSLGAHQTVTMYGLSVNEDRNSGWKNLGTSYGIPKAPINVSISPSSTVSGRITGSWGAPDYVGQSLNRYVVKRTDTVTGAVTTIVDSNTTAFTDGNLVRGRLYNYEIYIIGNSSPGNGLSYVVNGVMAPGIPSQPVPYSVQEPLQIVKVGRNVTVTCNQSTSDYGNVISGYRVQYSTDNGVTWSGALTMNNRSYLYELLPPALTYIFRCFAVNSIGNGDTTSSTPVFVSAGGRRKIPSGGFEPTQTAKRYDSARPEGQKWVDLNTAKRYSSAANGGLGGWVDLS